jgi:hypothetical protein
MPLRASNVRISNDFPVRNSAGHTEVLHNFNEHSLLLGQKKDNEMGSSRSVGRALGVGVSEIGLLKWTAINRTWTELFWLRMWSSGGSLFTTNLIGF